VGGRSGSGSVKEKEHVCAAILSESPGVLDLVPSMNVP